MNVNNPANANFDFAHVQLHTRRPTCLIRMLAYSGHVNVMHVYSFPSDFVQLPPSKDSVHRNVAVESSVASTNNTCTVNMLITMCSNINKEQFHYAMGFL
jgi:hypothetical protein